MLMRRALQPILFNKPNGIDGYTKLLLRGYGADASTVFTDASQYRHAITTGGDAQVDTAITKFGRGALLCDGSGDFVSTPDSADFTLGSNDFTVDGWFNVGGGAGSTRRMYGQSDASFNDTSFRCNLDTSNLFNCSVTSDGSTLVTVTSTTVFTAAGWHHFAHVRTGNILKLFIDGVQEGGDTAFTSSVFDSTSALTVGRLGALTTSTWNGSIEEFRLSVGKARWRTNFTPPTKAYS